MESDKPLLILQGYCRISNRLWNIYNYAGSALLKKYSKSKFNRHDVKAFLNLNLLSMQHFNIQWKFIP